MPSRGNHGLYLKDSILLSTKKPRPITAVCFSRQLDELHIELLAEGAEIYDIELI